MKKHRISEGRVAIQRADGHMDGSMSTAVPPPATSVVLAPKQVKKGGRVTHEEAVERMAAALAARGEGETFTPAEPFRGVRERWRGHCGKGHECSPRLDDVRGGQGICKECGNARMSKNKRLSGDEALAQMVAKLDARGLGESFTPKESFPGVSKPWKGVCGDGHACAPRLDVVGPNQGICKKCGSVRAADTLRFSDEEALARMDEALALRNKGEAFTPTEPYPGTAAPWKGLCGNGHECAPYLGAIQQQVGICPQCAEYGYNPAKPASLYLLADEIQGLPVVQFGISNDVQRRLREHHKTGFNSPPVAIIDGDGEAIADIEKRFKREQSRRGIPTCSDRGIKFDGCTEAFVLDAHESGDFCEWLVGQMGAHAAE